jgi:hypothetical protein
VPVASTWIGAWQKGLPFYLFAQLDGRELA